MCTKVELSIQIHQEKLLPKLITLTFQNPSEHPIQGRPDEDYESEAGLPGSTLESGQRYVERSQIHGIRSRVSR